ncbi:MAG TPA: thiamine biosynthesis protein ThiS [Flavobacteriales bacterium]|nr:thiamine biosynthesis protein ThiS [Flavobacteriales bacterium]|tara:strand:+ start:95548 stop:95751 length:204 start_codon:yes stop_codon:yes gene_type:complete
MTVCLNDKEISLPKEALTVFDLLKSQNISENGIAVAINQQVVSKSKWTTTQIKNNDKIIIITATQGG